MSLAALSVKNIMRQKGRSILTIIGIAVAIVLFVLMRTVVASWNGAVEDSAQDRIATRHKVTFVMTLPKKYADDIRKIPGVSAVNYANWFGGKEPNHPSDFFATLAVEADTLVEVYPEIQVDPTHLEAWKQNRRGALVGDRIAERFAWKVGQNVTLQGSIYPGNWEFIIEGIYTSTSKSIDRSSFWFHWDYLNEAPSNQQKDQIGWIASRIDDPKQSADISKQIDAMFGERDIQTLTMSEKAMQQSFLGMFSAILTAIDWVSIAILAIILLILGNTIAMSVRERTSEYGCLRAIGFQPRHIAWSVAGESLAIGALGGAVGLGLAMLFINNMMGPVLEENMGMFFPRFRVSPMIAGLALVVAMGLALLAAILPARRAAMLDVVTALRSVE